MRSEDIRSQSESRICTTWNKLQLVILRVSMKQHFEGILLTYLMYLRVGYRADRPDVFIIKKMGF